MWQNWSRRRRSSRPKFKFRHAASLLLATAAASCVLLMLKTMSINTPDQIAMEVVSLVTPLSNTTSLGRRRKAHFCKEFYCGRRPCQGIGYKILTDEFGFEPMNAVKDDNWDLIFGGYVYCGAGRRYDTEMKTGLNKVLNDRGWENLTPNQVWFPCMGCKSSYCNKHELCRLLRQSDPDSCYILPEDLNRLEKAMDGTRPWVLKYDNPVEHVHAMKGIKIIMKKDEIPPLRKLERAKYYIVQPFNEPLLGTGLFQRKGEWQVYVTVTSTAPLRAYAHKSSFVVLASAEYTQLSDVANNACLIDTIQKEECKTKNDYVRRVTFQDYAKNINVSQGGQAELMDKMFHMLANVIQSGHATLRDHNISKAIETSGAMCFSYMRADIGITSDLRPVLFEINELPNKVGWGFDPTTDASIGVREDSLRDLFHMIGLDQPPLAVDKRGAYEANNLGGWVPLHNLVAT